MSKLATYEELKVRWQQEKIAHKHQDAAEVMYEALQQIHQSLVGHTTANAEDLTASLECIETIAKGALATADCGGRRLVSK